MKNGKEITEDHYNFEVNRNAYSPEMLDDPISEEENTTLREYIEYGIDEGYLHWEKDEIDNLNTSQLSQSVDWVDYLMSK